VQVQKVLTVECDNYAREITIVAHHIAEETALNTADNKDTPFLNVA
jgi:hypothetical protein